MFTRNLETELMEIQSHELSDEDILIGQASDILKASTEDDLRVVSEAGFSFPTELKKKADHAKTYEHLDKSRIFHIDAIKKLCLAYRLRFLPTSQFKGAIPYEAVQQIRVLKSVQKTTALDQERISAEIVFDSLFRFRRLEDYSTGSFYIAAPKSSFQLLERPKDPLLFYALGNDQFYLVSKWGNDLSIFRKIFFWLLGGWWRISSVCIPLLASTWFLFHGTTVEPLFGTSLALILVLIAITVSDSDGMMLGSPSEKWNERFED